MSFHLFRLEMKMSLFLGNNKNSIKTEIENENKEKKIFFCDL